jgi:hypothetical protein
LVPGGVLQAKFLAIAYTEIYKARNFSFLAYHSRNGQTIPAMLLIGDLCPTSGTTNALRH